MPHPTLAFVPCDGGLTQSITLGRASVSGDGRDLHLVVDARSRSLPFQAFHPAEDGAVEATAESDDVHVHTVWTPHPGRVDVQSRLTALRPLVLSAFEHAYTACGAAAGPSLDDLWTPHLAPGRDHVIGAHALRTPCVVAQRGDVVAAIVPDIDRLETPGPLPPALDAERPATLRFGVLSHRAAGHIVFRRTPREGIRIGEHESIDLAFSILLAQDVPPHRGLGAALRFIWSRWGEARLDAIDPQALTFDDAARYAWDAAFDRLTLWREVFTPEGAAGGFASAASLPGIEASARAIPRAPRRGALSRLLGWPRRAGLARRMGGEERQIPFTLSANALRSAYGLAHFGRKWKDERLLGAGRAIVRLALAAPVQHGLFPSVCGGTPDRPFWARGTRGPFLENRYALGDLCESGRWMLLLRADHFLEKPLLERACALGDTLLAVQHGEGSIAAWLDVSYGGAVHASGPLRAHAPSAAGGSLLAHLALTTAERRYLDGARGAAAFIVDRVWPDHAWLDAETLWGCAGKPARFRDARTGLPPQGTLAMAWAVDLLLALREAGDAGWLDPGLAILDELLLHQQVWKAPYLRIDTRGGFGPGNLEASWNDARGALFAPLLLRAYDATGAREYLLRAAAALRAAFTLLHAPENARWAPGNMDGVDEPAYGAMPDDYGHAGTDARTPGPVRLDRGSGLACAAAAWVQRRYGDLFVDAARGHAVGLNGCRVTAAQINGKLLEIELERLGGTTPSHRTPLPRDFAETIVLRVRGPAQEGMRLRIDGRDLGVVERGVLAAGYALPDCPDGPALDARRPERL